MLVRLLGPSDIAHLLQARAHVVSIVGIVWPIVQRLLKMILRGEVFSMFVVAHAGAVRRPAVHAVATNTPEREPQQAHSSHGREPTKSAHEVPPKKNSGTEFRSDQFGKIQARRESRNGRYSPEGC